LAVLVGAVAITRDKGRHADGRVSIGVPERIGHVRVVRQWWGAWRREATYV